MTTVDVNEYDIGDGIVLEATFSKDGAPADPTTVVCKLRLPDRSIVELPTQPDGAGDFKATYLATTHGDHYYRFEGVGAVEAAGERRFVVRPSPFYS